MIKSLHDFPEFTLTGTDLVAGLSRLSQIWKVVGFFLLGRLLRAAMWRLVRDYCELRVGEVFLGFSVGCC